MNKILTVIILISFQNLFCQTETKKITRDELIKIASIKDTMIFYEKYPNGAVKNEELVFNTIIPFDGEFISQPFFIKTVKYRRNGSVRRIRKFNYAWNTEESLYSREGLISIKYIYHSTDSINQIITINRNVAWGDPRLNYDYYVYSQGKLYYKQSYANGKRHGLTELYDTKSGALKQIKEFKNGKKVYKKDIDIDSYL